MKQDKSEVILILDRSGSMSGIKTDVEGGLRTFLDKQAKEPGECLVSLYQFDDVYEAVFEARDIKQVTGVTLVPRNSTALYDAIGKTVAAVGERLAKTAEADRPGLVIVCVLTDGMENASKEWTCEKVAEVVKHQTETYSWRFLFLGANIDAVLTGGSLGYTKGMSMTYAATAAGVGGTFHVMSSGISCMRSASLVGADTSYSFTDDQRAAAMGNVPSTP